MKPITNILLVLALVCYVFLPLFNADFMGGITGLSFTSSLITESGNSAYTIYALVPFVSLFFAIGVNCLKNRYWGIAAIVFIVVALHFFANVVANFKGLSLDHDPEVAAAAEMGEGFPLHLGVGYYSSAALTALAFVSALISLMPFKFNKRLEQSIDSKLEESRKHISKVGHEIHDEFSKISSRKHHHADAKSESGTAEPPAPPAVNTEDESRFMPPGAAGSDAAPDADDDEERYRDYMPR